jgi:site-specific DNA-methyltransferase (adenine-specific)
MEQYINKIINADCLDILKQLPDKCIDLVLTDPPYNTTKCEWDIKLDLNYLFSELNRISKRQILFGIEPFSSELVMANKENFCEKITWKKHKAANIGNVNIRLLKYTEDMVVFGKGVFNKQYEERKSTRVLEAQRGNSKQWRTNRKETQEVSFQSEYPPQDWHKYDATKKLVGNVWEIPAVVSNSKEKTNHPTQKPVKLMERALKIYSNENDLVLDCFSGSGTTAIACHNLKRRFICVEKDFDYWKASCKRLEDAQRQGSLF